MQLAGHFENEDDAQAHFLGVQGEVDEFFIFVTIANDVGLRIVHVGQSGDQFGL